jgi:hypothetical protein
MTDRRSPERLALHVLVLSVALHAWNTSLRSASLSGERNDTPTVAQEQMPNTLTAKEKADGWRLLFDGSTTNGWRGYRRETIPDGWKAVDGALTRIGAGGDIVTVDEFDDFELTLQWRVAANGNSGVFYRVAELDDVMWHNAPEYQIIDNGYSEPLKPAQHAGANYDLDPPSRDATRPIGTWNDTRLVANGPHVEHWLNGVKVVEYELWTDAWQRRVAASKFKDFAGYGRARRGHIGLQDHGDRVAFRDIKLRQIRR